MANSNFPSWSGLIWKARKTSSGSFADMKSPKKYSIGYEDLDRDSYRSVTTGALKRTVVGRKWFKISFEYPVLTEAEVAEIMGYINSATLYIKAKDPAFSGLHGADGFVTMEGYVSKCDVEKLDGGLGYSMKFNFIQSKKGSWQ